MEYDIHMKDQKHDPRGIPGTEIKPLSTLDEIVIAEVKIYGEWEEKISAPLLIRLPYYFNYFN